MLPGCGGVKDEDDLVMALDGRLPKRKGRDAMDYDGGTRRIWACLS